MKRQYPRIAIVGQSTKAEEVRKLASLVGEVVEATGLQEALLEAPDMVIILGGTAQDWPKSYPIPVAAVITDDGQQVPPWVRVVRL